MILCIILLVLFCLLLILTTFFTMYFIIPSIKEEKRLEDPVIPKLVPPTTLPKMRNITPYEQMEFVRRVVRPIPIEEKIKLLNGEISLHEITDSEIEENSVDEKKSIEKNEDKERKDFKIWQFWYKLVMRIKF